MSDSVSRPMRITWVRLVVVLLGCLVAGNTNLSATEWDNGGDGTNWLDAANWVGDDIPDTFSEDATIDAGGAFDVLLAPGGSLVRVQVLTIGGDDTLGMSGGELEIGGGSLVNNGVFTVNGAGAAENVFLDPRAQTTISGNGILVLNASSDATPEHARIGDFTGFGVINGANHAIRGTGQVRAPLTNNGIISADVNGRTLFLTSTTSSNDGTLEATNGGILEIDSNVTNTGGMISADAGTVRLNTASITEGSIDSSNGGSVQVVASSTLSNIVSSAQLDVASSLTLNVNGIIQNSGTITLNDTAGSANTTLDPGSVTTFDGNGSVVLNASGDGALQHAQVGSFNDFRITNGADHTFRGTGKIPTSFTNDGVVSADRNGRTLLLESATKTNNNVMEAVGGGILQISATIENANGTIAPNDGTVLLSGGTINGGQFTGGQINVSATSTLNDVQSAANIDVAAGNELRVSQTISNSGTITLNENAAASNTTLNPNNVTTFTGNGEVVLNASSDTALQHAQVGVSNDFLINNATGHTFRGTGKISTAFTNDGLVSADVNGRTLLLDGAAKTNNHTMEAVGGGQLEINATINNAAGTIDPNNGIVVLRGATINSGALSNGQIDVVTTSTINGVTTSANIAVNAGHELRVADSIHNSGTIVINENAGSGNTTLNPNNVTTFLGSGEVVLNASSDTALQHSQVGASNDFRVINSNSHTFRGTGRISTSFTNDGIVSADVSGRTLLLDGALKTNNGTMQAVGGGLLRIVASVDNLNGVLDPSSGTVLLNGGTINDGQIAAGQVNVVSSSTINNVNSNAQIELVGGNTLNVNGVITNHGTITVNSAADSSNTNVDPGSVTTFNGSGRVVLNAPLDAAPQHAQVGVSNDFRIFNSVDHTFEGAGQISTSFTNNGLVSANINSRTLILNGGEKTNNGVFEATGGGILAINIGSGYSNGGVIVARAGSLVDVSGTLTNNGLLSGNGEIAANVVANNSRVNPGESTGILTINGDFNQPNGRLEIDIDGTTLSSEYDQLFVDGDVSLGGVLDVFFPNGFTPAAGDSFRIIDTSAMSPSVSVTGTFDEINVAGGIMNVVYGDRFVTLTDYEAISCDLNGDGNCDTADMRVLYDDIAAGATGGNTDLDGNGDVNVKDIDNWLVAAGMTNGKEYLRGDANLDGSVGGPDFTQLAANFGSSGLPGAYWDQGNFDGNQGGSFTVGGNDFTILASNFGHVSSVSVNSVPEPLPLPLALLAAAALLLRYRSIRTS